jgi:molybdopterin-guanine dinucleotide biosynthesis protein A
VPALTAYAAVVLDGGRSRRMGGIDKPGLMLHGATLRARAVAAVRDAVAVVLVGPPRPEDADLPVPVVRVREDPPLGGPLAALAAALPHLDADLVVVLAADLVDASALPDALLAALVAAPEAEAAVALDPDGRRQWLAAAYRTVAVRRVLDSLLVLEGVHGHRFGDLVDLLRVVDVPRTDVQDIDTPEDLARAEERLRGATVLDDWTRELAAALGVDLTVEVDTVLDLAGDAARAVVRPAAPVTTYLVGFAAARNGGDAAAVAEAVATARALAASWAERQQ